MEGEGFCATWAGGTSISRKRARRSSKCGRTAGGAGVEWYFGYDHPHNDLDCEDFRSRERMWDQTRFAMEFFRKHAPIGDLEPMDGLVASERAKCMARAGRTYVVYLESGGDVALTLPAGTYRVQWYDPRNGGPSVGRSFDGDRTGGPPSGRPAARTEPRLGRPDAVDRRE